MSKNSLRVCLIATELRGFGAYGGFGVLTHDLATGLAARGVDVFVVVPRKDGQRPVEMVGDVTVLSYPSPLYTGLRSVRVFAGVYGAVDADVYHSEEPSLGTALAMIGAPRRKHLVTFQDPRDMRDWSVEWAHYKPSRYAVLKFYLRYQMETGRAARRADARFCQAKCIVEKTRKMYRLAEPPAFLPNPIRLNDEPVSKAATPTVCYLGRWDERKRPELFFDLAARFPDVTFIAAGSCLNDRARDKVLRQRARSLPNVETPGWLDDRGRAEVLGRSWVLINTSTRECLPVSYLEAGAHRCAILSHCDADEFASRFGLWMERGTLDEYEHGLRRLLADGTWRGRGQAGRDYVRETHEFDRVIDQHIRTYERALGMEDGATEGAPHLEIRSEAVQER